jgi:hypothetical protein
LKSRIFEIENLLKRSGGLRHYPPEADLWCDKDRFMRANIFEFLPGAGFCGPLPALEPRRRNSSQESLGSRKKTPAEAEAWELDAYKVAVLLLVGAALLSLF